MIVLFCLFAPTFSRLLLREILQNNSYNPIDSPFDVYGEQLVVSIEITYVNLAYVEENRQVVSYIFNIEYVWMDRRLEFDVKETGIEYAILPANLVWIPTVDCYNCLMVENMDMETQFNEVRPLSPLTFSIAESILLRGWQTWTGLDCFQEGFFTTMFGVPRNGRSSLMEGLYNFQSVTFTLSYYNNSYGYSIAYISFKLTRNSEFYTVFLILPTMVVSSVSLAAILLPLEMTLGEKINMGITGMLGLTFLLSIIVVEVPRSQHLPVLGNWVIVEMFICILTLVVDEPVKAAKKRIRKKLDQHRIWMVVLDYVVFGVIFFGNILFTVLIFVLLPKNKKEIMF